MRRLNGLFLVLALGFAHPSTAENWPQWRGPEFDGVAAEGDYPIQFDSDNGVAWKVELPGVGCSTPAVWGDFTASTQSSSALCCDFQRLVVRGLRSVAATRLTEIQTRIADHQRKRNQRRQPSHVA